MDYGSCDPQLVGDDPTTPGTPFGAHDALLILVLGFGFLQKMESQRQGRAVGAPRRVPQREPGSDNEDP